MIKLLKQFWDDLIRLSKQEFGFKYVLPIVALFFSWGFLGHLYVLSLDKESLISCKGNVTSIDIKIERGTRYRYKYHPLKIKLNGYEGEFRLMDKFKKSFANIQNEVQKGDSIILYKRTKFQTILSWGKSNDIYHIEKNNKIIFSISSVKKDARLLLMILFIAAAAFWTLYILYKKKIILKKRSNP